MTEIVKDSKRVELICEFIKSGKQPDGFIITETKTGKYRLRRVKTDKETLEAKRKRLQKNLEDIDKYQKELQEKWYTIAAKLYQANNPTDGTNPTDGPGFDFSQFQQPK